MSIRKRFNELFDIEDSVEEEKKRFVERVNQFIFHQIDTSDTNNKYDYEGLFNLICFELGINAHDFQRRQIGDEFRGINIPAAIRTLTRDDFEKTIQILFFLHSYIKQYGNSDNGRKWLSENIEVILSRCTCDIGVRWKDGLFYPSGAEELDKHLIEESLTWLKDYPNERKDYKAAIQIYLVGEPLPDVIKNCY